MRRLVRLLIWQLRMVVRFSFGYVRGFILQRQQKVGERALVWLQRLRSEFWLRCAVWFFFGFCFTLMATALDVHVLRVLLSFLVLQALVVFVVLLRFYTFWDRLFHVPWVVLLECRLLSNVYVDDSLPIYRFSPVRYLYWVLLIVLYTVMLVLAGSKLPPFLLCVLFFEFFGALVFFTVRETQARARVSYSLLVVSLFLLLVLVALLGFVLRTVVFILVVTFWAMPGFWKWAVLFPFVGVLLFVLYVRYWVLFKVLFVAFYDRVAHGLNNERRLLFLFLASVIVLKFILLSGALDFLVAFT